MEKEAIINILLNDIKEMELLISTFKNKSSVPATYFRLAKSKLTNIGEELDMVEELFSASSPTDEVKTATTAEIRQPKPSIEEKKTSEIEIRTPAIEKEEIKTPEVKPVETVQVVAPVQAAAPVKPEVKNNTTTPTPEISAPTISTTTEKPENKPIESPKPVVETIHQKKASQQPHTNGNASLPKAEPAIAKIEKNTIGETIALGQQSINETLGKGKSHEDIASFGTPVNDIRKAIGINDRFYFQRELFDNNNTLMNSTLDQINTFENYNQAYIFLKNNFKWDESKNETEDFLRAVRRRFL